MSKAKDIMNDKRVVCYGWGITLETKPVVLRPPLNDRGYLSSFWVANPNRRRRDGGMTKVTIEMRVKGGTLVCATS
jgi:hypothetical protein